MHAYVENEYYSVKNLIGSPRGDLPLFCQYIFLKFVHIIIAD